MYEPNRGYKIFTLLFFNSIRVFISQSLNFRPELRFSYLLAGKLPADRVVQACFCLQTLIKAIFFFPLGILTLHAVLNLVRQLQTHGFKLSILKFKFISSHYCLLCSMKEGAQVFCINLTGSLLSTAHICNILFGNQR